MFGKVPKSQQFRCVFRFLQLQPKQRSRHSFILLNFEYRGVPLLNGSFTKANANHTTTVEYTFLRSKFSDPAVCTAPKGFRRL